MLLNMCVLIENINMLCITGGLLKKEYGGWHSCCKLTMPNGYLTKKEGEKMKKVLKILAISLLGVFIVASTALADPQLDFGIIAPTPGSISYAGGLSPLVGIDIQVDNVVGLVTPANNNGTLDISGGLLNFSTGAYLGSPDEDSWSWGGGRNSFIKITGGIPDLNIPDGTALLLGYFGTADVAYLSGTYNVSFAMFFDQKLEALLAYYGITPQNFLGNFNISFNANAPTDPFSFASTGVLSGDVVNTPIPEPATLLLLGLGLVGIGLVRRKK